MSLPLIVLTFLIAAIIFLAAIIFIRTALFARPQKSVEPVTPMEVDAQRIAGKLSEGVRCKTISNTDPTKVDQHAFLQIRMVIEKSFPYVNRFLEKHETGTNSLMYIWKGTNEQLKPIVLMGHLDVVPVDDATLKDWEHEPFSGEVADGFVWGRGALDCKSKVFGILEAVELLVQKGFKPERTMMLVFGHDEEVSSMQGAKGIADWLKAEGIEVKAVLDEGGYVQSGVFPGVKVPVAVVGYCEKGYLSLELKVEDGGGHSALPPKQTTIGILSRAIDRLQSRPFPARMETSKRLMQGGGAALPVFYQIAFANLWLFGGLVRKLMRENRVMNALIRTTTAPTMISGGVKENVLPQTAMAVVNFRIMPGDSIASVCDYVRKVINDKRVQFQVKGADASEPTPASPTDTPMYKTLARVIQQTFDNAPVAPMLVLGATDAHYFVPVCQQIYRFGPLVTTPSQLQTEHGVNERVGVEALGKMVQFYAELIQQWSVDTK
jgi:carboxypeptidase PM20D1